MNTSDGPSPTSSRRTLPYHLVPLRIPVPGPRDAAPPVPSPWTGDRGGHLWAKDHEVVRGDGTRIRYTVRGPQDGPWVVGVAGYLCPDNFWRDLAPDLARDHRVVLLNYRGIGASTEAGGGWLPTRASDYEVPHLAGDVAAVLDDLEARDVTCIGHSMGVQVALALWHDRPDLVGALTLVAGAYASPFARMYGSGVGSVIFPFVSMAGAAAPRALTRRLMRAIELPVALPVGKRLQAIGELTPLAGMTPYRAHLSRVDPRTAIWTARGMHTYDPSAWLHLVDVPTSIIGGDRDGWCPVGVNEELAAAIPGARLEIVDGASHTLPLEHPELVLTHVRRLTGRPAPPHDEVTTGTGQ